MDPEAPKPEDRGDSASGGDDSVRRRVDELTSKKPESSAPDKAPKDRSRPVLTEKQRREARRARQMKRRRKPVKGNPISKGMRATGFEIRRTAAFLGGSVIAALAALGPVFSAAGMGLVWLIEQIGKGLKSLGHLIARVVAVLGRLVLAVDKVVTPHRALILVAAVASVLLAVSQYKGLGQIEIGQAGYAGIEDLARAPATDKTTPAGVHTQILVPIAVVGLLSVVVIAMGSLDSFARRLGRFRRFAAMLLVAIGLLTLVVALLIDLPEATDTAEASLLYVGAQARLLSGFWLELAAGAALTVTGLALLLEPGAGKVKDRQRQSRTRDDDGREGRASAVQVINGGSA